MKKGSVGTVGDGSKKQADETMVWSCIDDRLASVAKETLKSKTSREVKLAMVSNEISAGIEASRL